MKFASFVISRNQEDELQQRWDIYKIFPPTDSGAFGRSDYVVIVKSPVLGGTHLFPISKDFDKIDHEKPLGGKMWQADVSSDQVMDEAGYKILKPADPNFKSQEQINQEIAAQGDTPPTDLLPPEEQAAMDQQQQAAAQDPNAQPQVDANGQPIDPNAQPQTDEQGNPIVPDEQQAQVQQAPAQEQLIREYVFNRFVENN